MSKIFIAHSWSDDGEYNDKQLSFIRLLQLELEHKGLEVVFDDSTINKDSLNRFMIENVKIVILLLLFAMNIISTNLKIRSQESVLN